MDEIIETTQPKVYAKDGSQLPATVLVIFGITGNLSKKKLLPALYHLLRQDMLPQNCKVIGIFRNNRTDLDQIMNEIEVTLLRETKECDPEILHQLRDIIIPFEMDSTVAADFDRLHTFLEQLDSDMKTTYQRLFYLAIPPDIFQTVIDCLGSSKLNLEADEQPARILVEKPFGTNFASAKELVQNMSQHFGEHQIYRIDHYLAKETAQNILAFRFSNPLIEDLWGRQFIDHIQISALETIDIEGRSNFYDNMGALRDIVQSHLLQLMSLTMMEAPKEMNSREVHEEKLALLNAIEPIKLNHVEELAVRGQYKGYKEEVQNPETRTETYAAVLLEVANSRWGGVPVLLRTGKATDAKFTDIKIVFKERSRRNSIPNILSIRIQPNEGISIRLTAKKPGFQDELQPVDMDFAYSDSFDDKNPDAYERVLVDAIAGDQTLFATSAEVLRSWEILDPILEFWQFHPADPSEYAKNSWGPEEAKDLAKSVGSEWLSFSTRDDQDT